MSADSDAPVLFETLPAGNGYRIGVATLNAPKSLNSLTTPMVKSLKEQLSTWREDDEIACVLLRGSGDRAFCAGGDVVQMRDSSLARDERAEEFFEQEYRVDYLIHTFGKPILVWGHGVVMGGGLGLMAGASHRVVTAETRLAMPEVTIGLYPDVGGSWFLNRMPGRTGLFLALTGAQIKAGDTLYLGLADRFLAHDQWSELVETLTALEWQSADRHAAQLNAVLRELEAKADEPSASVVRAHYDEIQRLTDADSLDEIVEKITGYDGDDDWLRKAAKTLASGCPTTIRLIPEQLRRAKHLSLREVFQMELVISANCMRFDNFHEGVRALLVDKDKNPAFDPPTLGEVSQDFVDRHFQPPWDNKSNPLADL